ncbi:Thioesterase/thiol ester dehydrase-isomerase [Cucurbitaria berberidis CBS 394.84]|uniref:Thioesterase/thiol ester dehydrase-isomerase n=1 Tax=Cucurbitaria berberidis CBS 394.84 TaxID=1168544 RepID=A0A9P4G9Z2_9PLEO|nr:Thioesterase/thiol ester dehydrase-isomerase [Cucurbitaria berberidis CBS 394.84]KAF1841419.1 Thioesterase/thiol ester dehydrase-isomerase [Cucurbitaria berberidis CBS 394.84]
MNSRAQKHATMLTEGGNVSPLEKARKWFDITSSEDYDGHDAILSKILQLESVTCQPTSTSPHDSRTVFSFTVPRRLCNMAGSLHGGAVALIFDVTTSTAITACSRPGFWDTGHVSRNLNCTYLRPAPEGAKVFVESWVVHLGKRMGHTMATMRLDAEDGKVCYTCEHGKASVGSSSL